MPRTKRAKPLSERHSDNIKPSTSKVQQAMVDAYLKSVDIAVAEADRKIDTTKKEAMMKLQIALQEQSLKFPHSNCKTMAELKFENTEIGSQSSVDTTGAISRTGNKNALSRSKMQSTIRKAPTARASRSLSRSKLGKALAKTNSFTTPISNNISSGTFGAVTPKVKPNTPQILLRRPKLGETAISMQGSPLLVSGVTSDQTANVNIPLQDGRVLSIQPQRGLRVSQFPDIDPETKRQIETLRDNLNKVCAFTAGR